LTEQAKLGRLKSWAGATLADQMVRDRCFHRWFNDCRCRAFSITIVALQLLLRILVRDCCVTCGTRVIRSSGIHCHVYLLLARTADSPWKGYNVFVPQISVTVGILLAIASISVLIYFIHHASTIIQASHVISEAGADLDNAIERLFPEQIGRSVSNTSGRLRKCQQVSTRKLTQNHWQRLSPSN